MHVMPAHAPLVALFLVATLCAGAAAVVVTIAALVARRTVVARYAAVGAACLAIGYLAVLVGVSLRSSDIALRPGQWKYICELDCHTAYSVQTVTRTRVLGSTDGAVRATGEFWVVRLRTWFDERTTRFRVRKRPLVPNARGIWVADGSGRRYSTSLAGMRAADAVGDPMIPLTQGLFPGDSYDTTLVFDLPPDVRSPRLMLFEPDPITWLMVGHENSFLHGDVYFDLAAPAARAVP